MVYDSLEAHVGVSGPDVARDCLYICGLYYDLVPDGHLICALD